MVGSRLLLVVVAVVVVAIVLDAGMAMTVMTMTMMVAALMMTVEFLPVPGLLPIGIDVESLLYDDDKLMVSLIPSSDLLLFGDLTDRSRLLLIRF